MKHLTIVLLLIAMLLPLPASAQDQKPDERQRAEWFKEMRAKKHEFMATELELTKEQKEAFFEIYDKMDDEIKAINDRTRKLERSVLHNENATDAEYDAAIEAVYNQRFQEWTIENQAKEQLAKILTKKQLLKLKKAEFKFSRALMKQHMKQNREKGKGNRQK